MVECYQREYGAFDDVVNSLKSAISNVEKKGKSKAKHEENITQKEILRRRIQEKLKIQDLCSNRGSLKRMRREIKL